MRIFGEHGLRTQFIHVGEKKIHVVENSEGTFTYRRDNVRVKILGGMHLSILPAPAKGYGVRFLMVKLEPSVAVPPTSIVKGYLEAPIDVKVLLGGTEIDRFTPCREKYALYGEDNVGVIARYAVSQFFSKKPNPTCALIPLLIKNEDESWFHLRRLVFPIGNCPMFYHRDEAYYPQMIVHLKKIPFIVNTGNPPDGTLNVVGTPRRIVTFSMRWL